MAASRTTLGAAVAALGLAIPAAAQAASVAPSSSCVRYVGAQQSTLGVTTSGWPAATPLTFAIDSAVVGKGTTDASGAFRSAFVPPKPKRNVQSVTLVADNGAGARATARMKIVRLRVKVPSRAKPSQRVRYRAYGFAPGRRLYLFVRRDGKTQHRFSVGKPHGQCGTLTKRMRYMPLHHWHSGTYEFWYGHSRHYSKRTRIYGYSIRISRTLLPGSLTYPTAAGSAAATVKRSSSSSTSTATRSPGA